MTRRPRARTECGASAVEYALLIFLIALFIVGAVLAFGSTVEGFFGNTCDGLTDLIGGDC